MKKWVLILVPCFMVVLFGAAELVVRLLPRADKDFHLQDFGRLPVLLNGRVQPLDTVGRNALLQIRSTTAVPLEETKSYQFWKHPRKLKAAEWLLEVLMEPAVADTRPIFLIHHPDLLNELELRGKGQEKSGLFFFSYNALTNVLPKIEQEGGQVMNVEAQLRTAYQRQVAKLYNALVLYQRLKNSLQPEPTADFARELEQFQTALPAGLAAVKASQAGQQFDKAAFDRLTAFVSQYDELARQAYFLMVPQSHPGTARDRWQNMGQALLISGLQGGELPPAVGWYAAMSSAWRQHDPTRFNLALDQYGQWLAANAASELSKGRLEFFFNNLQVFAFALRVYLVALLFLLVSVPLILLNLWPTAGETMRRSGLYLAIFVWVVHTGGLILRMWLERRPPVTTLYSSAVFIGWVAVLLGIIIERIYRFGIGGAAASIIGFVTLIIAHNLALGGDTIEVMRAVLDNNFWLTTHVTTITLGYAANFLAGFVALFYVLFGLISSLLGVRLRRQEALAMEAVGRTAPGPAHAVDLSRQAGRTDLGQALDKIVYGIICFAMLFSFVGTVLGGIWADQSWGRFWGWDPKENGALIIVLWNAVILHVRWDRLMGERGLMNMALFGSIVTAFSWFGVNMLGVGLHSYGFMDAAFDWLMLFVGSQMILISVGLLPQRHWRANLTPLFSFQGRISRAAFARCYFCWLFLCLGVRFALVAWPAPDGTAGRGGLVGGLFAALGQLIHPASAGAAAGSTVSLLIHLCAVCGLALLVIVATWSTLAVSVKRLHDRGRPGAFLLVLLIPFAGPLLMLLELFVLKGTSGPNPFGADPIPQQANGPAGVNPSASAASAS
jgi:cytochrome c-type biogenesis protein CcsB